MSGKRKSEIEKKKTWKREKAVGGREKRTIAELSHAIEELVVSPRETGRIWKRDNSDEARTLAQQWKNPRSAKQPKIDGPCSMRPRQQNLSLLVGTRGCAEAPTSSVIA